MLEGRGVPTRGGTKGENWDNGKNIINKIYLKKWKKAQKDKTLIYRTVQFVTFEHIRRPRVGKALLRGKVGFQAAQGLAPVTDSHHLTGQLL